jgi:hypothetical protein
MMFDTLRDELRQNLRFRLGLLVLAVIAVWNLALYLRDGHQRSLVELTGAQRELARAQADVVGNDWHQNLKAARAYKAEADAALWRQPTLGLAQVRFQEWLRAEFEIVGIQPKYVGPVLTASALAGQPTAASLAGLSPVRVRFEGDFDAARLDRFLARIHAATPRVYLEQLIVRPDATQRFEGIVVAYFVDPEAKP